MSTTLLVIALCGIVLRYQQSRHQLKTKLTYLDLGLPEPPVEPRLPRLECWLNIAVGAPLLFIGVFSLQANFAVYRYLAQIHALTERTRPDFLSSSLLVGVGIALISLGILALRELNNYKLNHPDWDEY